MTNQFDHHLADRLKVVSECLLRMLDDAVAASLDAEVVDDLAEAAAIIERVARRLDRAK